MAGTPQRWTLAKIGSRALAVTVVAAVVMALTMIILIAREPVRWVPPPPPPPPPVAPAPPPALAPPTLPEPTPQARTKAVREFKAVVREADPSRTIVQRVEVNSQNPDEMLLVVTMDWMRQPRAVRQTAAESLQMGWASANEANQPNRDRSSVVLLAPTGRKVGGSRTDRTATWVQVED